MIYFICESKTNAVVMLNFFQIYLDRCNRQIDQIVELVRGQLEGGTRITLGALTVIDVHGEFDRNFQKTISLLYILIIS